MHAASVVTYIWQSKAGGGAATCTDATFVTDAAGYLTDASTCAIGGGYSAVGTGTGTGEYAATVPGTAFATLPAMPLFGLTAMPTWQQNMNYAHLAEEHEQL